MERFEVQSMATVDFTVGKLRPPSLDLVDSPAPTVPELSITVLLVALIAVLALLVVCRRKLVTPNADLRVGKFDILFMA